MERSDISDITLSIKQRKWRWLGHTVRKEHDDIINKSNGIPKVIVKWVDQNPPGGENSQMNLKRRSTKLSETLTVAASKEKWKDLVCGLRST